MSNKEGMEMKFTVLKNDDIQKYLGNVNKDNLECIIYTLNKNREIFESKTPSKYLVINTDESYADEVIEILKRHGHWG